MSSTHGELDRYVAAELVIAVASTDRCGECPVWDRSRQQLFWTDMVGRKFQSFDWATGKHEVVKDGIEIAGFRRNRPGGYVITNTSGIWTWDGAGELELVADAIEGVPLSMNDCTADSAGRLIAGSTYYDPSREYELGKLLSVDPAGKVTILDEGIHLSNGIGHSPDDRILYYADTSERVIYAYDYDIQSGSVSNRRIFVRVPPHEGIPDGLTVDSEGFIWSAQWYGSCVVRYDPDGKEERRIHTPAKQTSSVTFGGPDLDELYITSAGSSEALPCMPPGYDPTAGFFGGPLYRVRVDIQGREQGMTNISPRGV
ncbi:MAG TPA: SMP-30/gluconolactonase/LRE family protein [Bryobacteraceae bacterium]|nr:SMP-30/gluconolactonase/LRE family protein [Bryobacteraceae bacterium]